MSDAGRTDEYAPNSDLDRDEGQMICIIDGNGVQEKFM